MLESGSTLGGAIRSRKDSSLSPLANKKENKEVAKQKFSEEDNSEKSKDKGESGRRDYMLLREQPNGNEVKGSSEVVSELQVEEFENDEEEEELDAIYRIEVERY